MKSDSEIIALFLERSEQAIAELSAKYGSACKDIASNILKNGSDAEECVNDAMLAMWNKIPPENPDPLKTYLYRIVRNISAARYHSNTSQKRNSFYDVALDELEECLAFFSTVERETEAEALSKQLDNFLEGLDRESRVLFVRRYWYSESGIELAKRFGVSEAVIYKRLSRMRERLKQHLKKEGYEI